MQKGKVSVFDRVVNQLSAAASTTSTTGGTTTASQAASALLRFGNMAGMSVADRNDKNEEPINEEDGLLDLHIAEKMLKWHAEAIGRCVELTSTNDVYVHLSCLLGPPVTQPQRKAHFLAFESTRRSYRDVVYGGGHRNVRSSGSIDS